MKRESHAFHQPRELERSQRIVLERVLSNGNLETLLRPQWQAKHNVAVRHACFRLLDRILFRLSFGSIRGGS